MKISFSLAFLFLCNLTADAHYTLTPTLVEAQKAIFQLKLYKASRLVQLERQSDPANRMTDVIESYCDCSRLTIDEDIVEYDIFIKKRKRHEGDMAGVDKESPYYLFNKAEIALQWTVVKLKYREYLHAAFEVKSAYNALQENIRKHPDFLLNYKSMSMLKALIGTIPDSYRWVQLIVGIDGDIDEGFGMMNRFLTTSTTDEGALLFRHNGRLLLAYMTLHIRKQKEEAWRIVNEITADHRQNLFNTLNRASFAMKCGYNDEAIDVLSNAPDQKNFYPLHFLDYLMGVAKVHRLDDDADVYLKRYIEQFKGKDYLKDACLKLSWFYTIRKDAVQAAKYMALIKSVGHSHLDEDKYAQKQAEKKEVNDVTLLRVHMLFDGGYYKKALAELNDKTPASFSTTGMQAEFLYRKARIQHEMGLLSPAIEGYHVCIDFSRKLPYYYAANSCLQLGYIYEQLKHYTLARQYYEQCLTFNNHGYNFSMHQKAKTGLRRLEGK